MVYDGDEFKQPSMGRTKKSTNKQTNKKKQLELYLILSTREPTEKKKRLVLECVS